MPTALQLSYYGRKKKKKISKTPALSGCPQKEGICAKVFVVPPKKPNSAKRRVTRIILSNRKTAYTSIPGEGHNLKEYSHVLIRGGRVKDLPGVKYKVVRGKLDALPVFTRFKGRSKYGKKRPSPEDMQKHKQDTRRIRKS